jgi:S-adenosylmethionine decarboxylase
MTTSAEATIGRAAPSTAAFLIQAALWNVALFALIRLSWFDQHVIDGLVSFQKTVIAWYGATAPPGIVVNSSCSGADVMALCTGVLLAYPAAWRRRLVGAALGIGLILALNAVRIASLYAAATPARLELLHVYVWPALLTLATVLYVIAWIRWGEGRATDVSRRWTRFGVVSIAGLVAHAAAAPWVLTSPLVLEAGAWTAAGAASLLIGLGATARAAGSVLLTSRGAFQVTQECLFTPMIPLYLAAVCSLPLSRRQRAGWLLMALPVFLALGIVRLLVLALPAEVASTPEMLSHGFYQIVAGAVLVIGAAHLAVRRGGPVQASTRTLGALAIAIAAGVAGARVWEPFLLVAATLLQSIVPATLTTLDAGGDRQGALALMPAFQVGLVTGLWFAFSGGRRARGLWTALAVLAVLQLMFLAATGSVSAWLSIEPHALVVRGWALLAPLVVALVWLGADGTLVGDRAYHRFWHDVGEEFPSLTGAASTTYYFENERRLLAEALPALAGSTLLKTDLWDEAKNTRIMQWAADQGARVYGIDLSEPIVRQARAAFGGRPLRPIVSDVRRLPFGDRSFDAIYSMGTVEHFAETEASVAELARILKPGGRLILGVPNRFDPFLRPMLVAVLNRLGLYGYGYEKSYSRQSLRRMLEASGLDVTLETGILFMPGWLRMLDLWCYTRMPRLARVTGALVQPFAWIDRRVAAVRRHGYLLASVGVKPSEPAATDGLSWQLSQARPAAAGTVATGIEYVVDARGCDQDLLRSLPRLQQLFEEAEHDLGLTPIAPPLWHVFPGAGGITGLVLLAESHLTIHTYPEAGFAAINLYCCRSAVAWRWDERLRALLRAREVSVQVLRRGQAAR